MRSRGCAQSKIRGFIRIHQLRGAALRLRQTLDIIGRADSTLDDAAKDAVAEARKIGRQGGVIFRLINYKTTAANPRMPSKEDIRHILDRCCG